MLKDKVIVITGGAGLIGRTFCKAVAENGGIVVVADINKDAADDVVEDINTHSGHAVSFLLDICDKHSIDNLIDFLKNKYGKIDAVVNNAYPRNKNYGRKLEHIEFNDFCENVNLHLGGYFLVSQRFGIYFQQKSCGNIVNIGSIYGVMAPRFSIYNETNMTMPLEYANIKAGVIHMTRYFAQYYKKDNVRCNCLSPGGVLDNQDPYFIVQYNNYCARGMLMPQDLVGSLIFLLSDASKAMTGQNLIIDDGFSL